MKVHLTITIEDSTPWYAPYSSQEEWIKAQRKQTEYEDRRLQRELEKEFGENRTKNEWINAFLERQKQS